MFADIDLRIASDLHVYGLIVPLQIHHLSEDHQILVSIVLHSANCDGISDVNGNVRKIHCGLPSTES
jgi:hypothetical protein